MQLSEAYSITLLTWALYAIALPETSSLEAILLSSYAPVTVNPHPGETWGMGGALWGLCLARVGGGLIHFFACLPRKVGDYR